MMFLSTGWAPISSWPGILLFHVQGHHTDSQALPPPAAMITVDQVTAWSSGTQAPPMAHCAPSKWSYCLCQVVLLIGLWAVSLALRGDLVGVHGLKLMS